jgi:hypothetical protein
MDRCPICGSPADMPDAEVFDCQRHGRYKLSRTVLAAKAHAACELWEAAFEQAKARQPDAEAPRIEIMDFWPDNTVSLAGRKG